MSLYRSIIGVAGHNPYRWEVYGDLLGRLVFSSLRSQCSSPSSSALSAGPAPPKPLHAFSSIVVSGYKAVAKIILANTIYSI